MGDSSSRSSPINFSGILGGGEDAPGSQIGSATGSLQNDSLLSGVDAGTADADFGFSRPEMRTAPLVGTVQTYDRHVFLCYKTPAVWPAHVEAAEFDRLPRLLSAALVARKPHIAKRTRLTLCEGEDGTDSSNGDVLIFPDMIRYRRLTHFDVDNFVDEVLVKDTEWLPGAAETLSGSYVFVCAHASRDRRCGVCGPVVIKRFQEEIGLRGLKDQVFVSPCSHIGGHKYAGNVIIFSSSINGEVSGHWYGYVSPDDVPIILDQHIGKGNIVDHLWRGQMGLSEEDQKNAQGLRLELNKVAEEKGAQVSMKVSENDEVVSDTTAAGSCCQGMGSTTCCQNGTLKDKQQTNLADSQEALNTFERKSSYKDGKASSSKRASVRRVCAMPTWFEIWEREDTYAAIAVVVAVASVAVAYSCYRQMK